MVEYLGEKTTTGKTHPGEPSDGVPPGPHHHPQPPLEPNFHSFIQQLCMEYLEGARATLKQWSLKMKKREKCLPSESVRASQ